MSLSFSSAASKSAAAERRLAEVSYFVVAGTASMATSISSVFLPAFASHHLAASPDQLGLIQAALYLPSMLFLIAGGALADKVGLRRLMVIFPCLACLAAMIVAAITSRHATVLILASYAFFAGTMSALTLPAREAMLPRVFAHANLTRVVTAVVGLQFAVQIAGAFVAAIDDWAGPVAVFAVQAAILAIAAAGALVLPRASTAAPERIPAVSTGVAGMGATLRQSRDLNAALSSGLLAGLCFFGGSLVLTPYRASQLSELGTSANAYANAAFAVGTMIGVATLLSRPIQRPGRWLVFGLAAGGLGMLPVVLAQTFPTFLAALAVWGFIGAIVMSMGRALVQLIAVDAYRARSTGLYQMGFLGGGAVGAFIGGAIIKAFGTPVLGLGSCAIALAATLAIARFTHLLQLEKNS